MTTPQISIALELAPILERVHGTNHPELTRVRELTQDLSRTTDLSATTGLFQELRTVTSNYAMPSDGCEAYTATYQSLKAADQAHAQANTTSSSRS